MTTAPEEQTVDSLKNCGRDAADPAAEALRKWAIEKAIQMHPAHIASGATAERVVNTAKEIERYERGGR